MPKQNSELRLTRGRLERLHHIDQALQRGEIVTCAGVANHFEVRQRLTIQKDIDYLRDVLRRPLEYDEKRTTWYYMEPVDPLPNMVITEGELFTLMAARSALEPYRGTRLFSQLTLAAENLARSLKTKVSYSAVDYASRMSVSSMGRPKIDPAVFDLVARAIAQKTELAFDYRKPEEPGPRRRLAQLWHIAQRGPMCYVIGYDPGAPGRRTFALPRIKNPVLTLTKFTVPKDFSPESHFANAFCVLGGTGDYRIVIRFRGASAVRVQECEWHESETRRDCGGGVVELELRLGALEEIERWVLSWGVEAEVIEPPALRDRVAASLAGLARIYQIADRDAPGAAAAG